MAEIVIENVAKNFGATRVLEQISITIGDGEMLVVLGPSGCGKSTLLRMVAGLETIGSGEIRIGGRRVNELEPAQRDIAMVFQNYALYPHMTVYDNMAYGLRNKRTPRPVIETRVKDAARILGLEPLLARRPRQLSGGQRQRVAMGRAIVREPQAFLFDEPLSNLDAKLRVQMRHEIRQLQSRLRTTGLYVTHDQLEAMTLGDRLVVLNAGHIEQIGRPLEVYARPASLFVAGFLGAPAMNTQPARIGEDGTTIHMGEVVLPAPAGSPPGQPVILGIRPEDLAAAAGETANLHLRVLWLEALGADTIAHGEAGGVPLAARIDGRLVPAIGDLLPLRVAAHALHLFAPSDGRRLALPSDEHARAA